MYSIVAAAIVLSGCKKSAEAPTGQVVATIDGSEITTADLQAELGGAVSSDPKVAARQQQAALQSILTRKALAAEAKKRGLDKTPAAAITRQKAEEMALVSMLEQSVVSKVPKVSRDEAQSFVREHPAQFSQRQMLTLNQFLVPQMTQELAKAIEPIDKMADIKALLDQRGVAYRTGGTVIDTMTLDPAIAGKIAAMNVGDTFVIPSPAGAQIAEIREREVVPLTGDQAVQAATAIVTQQRRVGQLREQLASVMRDAQKSIKLNPQFEKKGPADPKAKAKAD